MEMRSFWPKKGLSFFPQVEFLLLDLLPAVQVVRTIEGTHCSFFPKNGGAYGAWLFDLVDQELHESVSGSACSGRRSGIAWSVSGGFWTQVR